MPWAMLSDPYGVKTNNHCPLPTAHCPLPTTHGFSNSLGSSFSTTLCPDDVLRVISVPSWITTVVVGNFRPPISL